MTISTSLLKRLAYGVWGLLLAIALNGGLPIVTPATPAPVPITVITDATALPIDPAASALVTREVADAPNGDRVVIQTDDRVTVESQDYPWSAVGRLVMFNRETRTGGTCTASLIDVAWVLTNAHCAFNTTTEAVWPAITFQPNLINGRLENRDDAATVDRVILGTDFRDSGRGPDPNDWALLHLRQPLGSRYGTLRWQALPTDEVLVLTEQVKLVGYSGDFPADQPGETAGVHRGCSIVEDADPFWVHNCDSFSGASGGPLLARFGDEYAIVALHAGGVSDAETEEGLFNYAIKMDAIAAAINGEPYPPRPSHRDR
jgi:V8-like Glu-specific endopeptidase